MTDNKGHVWQDPPPGAGSRRNPVCAKCGMRRSVVDPAGECPGTGREATIETTHDYEPFE